MGMVSSEVTDEVERTLEAAGLPVRAAGMDPQQIYAEMLHDKKAKGGKLNFVLPKRIGEVAVCTLDDERLLMEVLEELVG